MRERAGRLQLNEKGFTLVELMVVLSIVAILVSIAVLSYSMAISQAKEVTCRHNLRAITDGIILYNTQQNENPDSLSELIPDYMKAGVDLQCPETELQYLYDKYAGDVMCSTPEHNLGSD